MNESQLRDLLGKGLAKVAAASINAVYPIPFQAVMEPERDEAVEAQAVASQLLYTRHFQVCSFLIMEAGQIFKLGQKAFPKCDRLEVPKIVISANSEMLNTLMGKLANLLGKVDEGAEVIMAPPLVLNCTGPDRLAVRGADSLFLKLTSADLSMLVIVTIQEV